LLERQQQRCKNRHGPVVNFINILRAAFAPIFWRQKISNLTVTTEKLPQILLYKKVAHKTLMKLTPVEEGL